MAKTLHNILIKDLGWKLFSLIAAVLLWFIATYSEDPIEQATVTADIKLISVDTLRQNGLTLLSPAVDKPGQVTITVSGKRSDIGKLDGKMPGLSAYVDFSGFDASYADKIGAPIPLTVNVNLPAAYTQISRTPKSLSVLVDALKSVSMVPEVTLSGSPNANYQAMPYSLSPASIDIEGPASVIATVKSVSLQSVSIADASQDVQTQKRPIVYDKNNQDVTGKLTLSADEVTVYVPINLIRNVKVSALLNVNPAPGYRIAGEVTYDPPSVDIVGKPSELDKLPAVVLGTIRADQATEDVVETFDIRRLFADENLEIYVKDGSPYEITATVPIAKESSKSLLIPVSRLNTVNLVSAAYKAAVAGPVSVTVRGLDADLEGLGAFSASYSARLDLSGLGPGTHSVKVDFQWPNGVSETVSVRAVVTITDENAAASESPPPAGILGKAAGGGAPAAGENPAATASPGE
ncbi:MAG: CdaR family protein [Firmicutes bacterium]|nr:CdaR family protein [Bacillota bacterium]